MKAKYLLYEFKLGDVEDPELYLAAPVYEWQQTDHGKWCMEKATEVKYHIHQDWEGWGYHIQITGILKDKYATFYELKKA